MQMYRAPVFKTAICSVHFFFRCAVNSHLTWCPTHLHRAFMSVSSPSPFWAKQSECLPMKNYSGRGRNNNLPSLPTSDTHFRPSHVLSTSIQWRRLNPFSWVLSWLYRLSDPAGSLHFASLCCDTGTVQTKNQTLGLLWRSAAIITQAPTLFYAWISAPESTNRWLFVLCAHEWHVRAVKWYLSVSRGELACGSADQDACLRLSPLWTNLSIFSSSLDLTKVQNFLGLYHVFKRGAFSLCIEFQINELMHILSVMRLLKPASEVIWSFYLQDGPCNIHHSFWVKNMWLLPLLQ